MHKGGIRVLCSLAAVCAIAVVTSTLLLHTITVQTQVNSTRSLRALAETTSQSVSVWAEKEQRIAAALADDPRVVVACESLLSTDRVPARLIESAAQEDLRAYLEPHLNAHGYLGFFIIAPDGVSLASTRDTNIGTPNLLLDEGDYFTRILAGESILAPPQLSDVPLPSPSGQLTTSAPTMFVGTPIRSASGEVIAAFTVRLSPATHLSPIFQLSAPWDQGVTYAFNADGHIITEPKTRDEWVQRGLIGSESYASLSVDLRDPSNPFRPAETIRARPDLGQPYAGENVEGFTGFDGARMYSAWVWDPALQIGVETERTEAAALGPVRLVRIVGRAVITFTLLLVLLLLLLFERAKASAELGRKRLESVISTMLNGLVTLDQENRILSWNRAAERITGFTAEEVVGTDIRSVIPEPWTSGYDTNLQQHLDAEGRDIAQTHHRVSVTNKSGESVPIDLSIGETVVLNRSESVITGVIHDVRGQLKAEEAERARKVAEEASHAKSKFLASMSHEIRTPLNVILGFAQILERDDLLSAQQKSAVGSISRSGEHLLELINDVLEMAKIEAGQVVIDKEILPLDLLLDSLRDMFELRAESKSLHFDVQPVGDLPAAVEMDRRKLRQILINLLGNAFKFTEVGGIVLRVGEERRAEGVAFLRFEVEDTGPGVPQGQYERIFHAFEQTLEGRRTQGGTGLGLAISRQLAIAMGGSLSLESVVGRGSTFILRLPARVASASEVPQQIPELEAKVVGLAANQPEVRLLIVDDTESNRRVLDTFLSLLGIETREAADGLEAVEAVKEWRPTIVLMDLAMPNLNGYEATKLIRALPHGDEAAIIVLSASSFNDEEDAARKMGANGFLRKPFKLDDLLATIELHAGIEWAYSTSTVDSRTLDSLDSQSGLASFSLLPSDLLETIAKAAKSCLSDEIRAIAERIAPAHPDIAGALEHCLSQFDFEQILTAAESAQVVSHDSSR